MTTPQWEPGRLLRDARQQLGLSLRDAATRANISHAYYRWLELGERSNNGRMERVNPSVDALTRAAQAVGANPKQVLEAAGLDPAHAGRQQLHDLADTLPTDQVDLAVRLLRQLD